MLCFFVVISVCMFTIASVHLIPSKVKLNPLMQEYRMATVVIVTTSQNGYVNLVGVRYTFYFYHSCFAAIMMQ